MCFAYICLLNISVFTYIYIHTSSFQPTLGPGKSVLPNCRPAVIRGSGEFKLLYVVQDVIPVQSVQEVVRQVGLVKRAYRRRLGGSKK